jgi:hypothetical protein
MLGPDKTEIPIKFEMLMIRRTNTSRYAAPRQGRYGPYRHVAFGRMTQNKPNLPCYDTENKGSVKNKANSGRLTKARLVRAPEPGARDALDVLMIPHDKEDQEDTAVPREGAQKTKPIWPVSGLKTQVGARTKPICRGVVGDLDPW